MDTITTIGLDIAKNSFAVHGFDAGGVTVLTKELKRAPRRITGRAWP
jgi:transposase